jgi:hypothetical protein
MSQMGRVSRVTPVHTAVCVTVQANVNQEVSYAKSSRFAQGMAEGAP